MTAKSFWDAFWAAILSALGASSPADPPAPSAGPLLDAINRERAKVGVPPLRENPALTSAARGHAAWMADNITESHADGYGDGPSARIGRAGYRWRAIGENVTITPEPSEAGAMDSWMGSDPHRRTMLSRTFQDFGYGSARGRDGLWYWCADFAEPG